MANKLRTAVGLIALTFCLAGLGIAQTQPAQSSQDIPDAPSPQPGAGKAPAPSPIPDAGPPASGIPASELPPREGVGPGVGKATGKAPDDDSIPTPPLNVRTVPQGGATPVQNEAQEQLFTISTRVNQVMIPVSADVQDEDPVLAQFMTNLQALAHRTSRGWLGSRLGTLDQEGAKALLRTV